MEFINYLISVILLFLASIIGIYLGLMAFEELAELKNYLKIIKRILFLLIIVSIIYILMMQKSIILMICVAVIGLILLGLSIRYKEKIVIELLVNAFIGILFYILSTTDDLNAILIVSGLMFVHYLISGANHLKTFAESNNITNVKSVKKLKSIFYDIKISISFLIFALLIILLKSLIGGVV